MEQCIIIQAKTNIMNVHLIKTNKPSRLRIHECGQLFLSVNFIYEINDENKKHIYITSDEEIKKGDWFLFPLFKKGYKIKKYNSEKHFAQEPCISLTNLKAKKIILTTDQDLIKDGIQAIDDEFLEWFVKNPSCEEIKVNKLYYGALSGFADAGYKIIIPKEEPKQETLEEFINSQPYYGSCTTEYLEGVEVGSKWQQERMYNESDIIMDFLDTEYKLGISDKKTIKRIKWYFETYFEQFKKKA